MKEASESMCAEDEAVKVVVGGEPGARRAGTAKRRSEGEETED